MVRTIIFLIFFELCLSPAWARECKNPIVSYRHNNGCTFKICKAAIVSFPVKSGDATSKTPHPSEAFLVELEILNHTSVKKIDLLPNYRFRLWDNYLNKYALSDGDIMDNQSPLATKQNLYPGDSICHTLIFEAPVSSFQELVLSIDNISQNKSDEEQGVQLAIPKEKITLDTEHARTAQLGLREIAIIQPAQYVSVQPDEIVHLQMTIEKDTPLPDSIFIVSADYILEDPKSSMRYDIRIPKLASAGLFPIHIIAKWNIGEEIYHISKTLFLNVVDPQKDCLINCLNKKSPN